MIDRLRDEKKGQLDEIKVLDEQTESSETVTSLTRELAELRKANSTRHISARGILPGVGIGAQYLHKTLTRHQTRPSSPVFILKFDG